MSLDKESSTSLSKSRGSKTMGLDRQGHRLADGSEYYLFSAKELDTHEKEDAEREAVNLDIRVKYGQELKHKQTQLQDLLEAAKAVLPGADASGSPTARLHQVIKNIEGDK